MSLLERIVPPALWVLFIAEAINGGLSIPHADLPIKWAGTLPMLAFFFAGGVIAALVMRRKNARESFMWKGAAALFGEAELANIEDRTRFPLLAATFFTLLGGMAWLGCLRAGSPQGNVFLSQVSLSVGLGAFLGLALTFRRDASRSA